MKNPGIAFVLIGLLLMPSHADAEAEIRDPTHTRVAVKKHPKTGKPYVTILPENTAAGDAEIIPAGEVLPPQLTPARPDYRMLDWKVKDGAVPYDGPSSDRTKIYVFAASLATLGVVSGAAVMAAAPAAGASTAGTGGAGIYAAGGAAVTAGTVSTALIQTKPDAKQDDYDYYSESKEVGKKI